MSSPTPPPGPEESSGTAGGFGAPAVPYCYRHPGRETYIRCQRCNRPICPECQIPAPVGFQCPECVRESNRSTPKARTTFGGVVPRGDGAIVTKTIIGICVVVYLAQLGFGGTVADHFGMLGRANIGTRFAPEPAGIADGEYYRLITAAFLHGSIAHIGVNMLSLWLLGPPLEQRLGRARFITLYLVGALGGSAASYLFNSPRVLGVGASGAIFALFGALLPISRKMRYPLSPYITMLAINAAIGFLAPNIDWKAHLGGLVTGVVLGAAVAYAPRARRDAIQIAAAVGMLAVIAAVVVYRTSELVG
jgi:membrane associated rhomboid family serine protease